MAVNVNSAYRLREILSGLSDLKLDTTPVHEIWANAFNLDSDELHRKNFSISRCLSDLHEEVEAVRSGMLELNFSIDLFDTSLDACNRVFGVHTLMQHWSQVVPNITPIVMNTLGFCSEILPNEEDLIDGDNLDELRSMVNDLKSTINESTLPAHVINIISKHISNIENALASYNIVGAKAFDEVIKAAYGEVIVNEDIFKEASGTKEMGLLKKVWNHTQTALDGITSVNKRLGGVQGMAEKGHKLLELMDNVS